MRAPASIALLLVACAGEAERGPGTMRHAGDERAGGVVADDPPAAHGDAPTTAAPAATEDPPPAVALDLSAPAAAPSVDDEAQAIAALASDRLHVVRTIPVRPRLAYPRVQGQRVFGWGWVIEDVGGGDTLVAIDPRGAAPTVSTPCTSFHAGPEYTDAVESGNVLTVEGEDLVVIDPVAGRARWRTPLPIPPEVTRRAHPFVTTAFARAGDVLAGLVGDPILDGWRVAIGYGWRDGRVLWQRPTSLRAIALASTADRLYVLAMPDRIVAIDARDGREVWNVAGGQPWHGWERIAATGGSIVVVRETGFLVLGEDGRARRFVSTAPRFVDTLLRTPVIDGDRAFAVLLDAWGRRSDELSLASVAAIDLASGTVTWRTPERTTSWMAGTPLIVDSESVVVCFDDEVLRALDRATGAPIGELGAGGWCENVALDPDAQGRRAIVARVGTQGERVLLERAPGAPPPLHVVRLRGRVTREGAPAAGAVVVSRGSRTDTARDGSFDLTVAASGALTIGARSGTAGGGTRLEITRSGTHDLVIAIEEPGPIDF